jgi:serine/threonine protein kinase
VLLARNSGIIASCKLADFGFTSVGESGQQYSSLQGRMTLIYGAPELIIHGKYSKKSDIWAVGCILYEACFAMIDRRRAFRSVPAITSYYFNENIPPPQIDWDDFESYPDYNTAAERYQRFYKSVLERELNSINIIFASIFRRKPEERPTALELRDNLNLIIDGKKPTLTDYR